jgi:16S rRNA (guanine527-N7)-methyltransferase
MTEEGAKIWLHEQLGVSAETMEKLQQFANFLTREASSQNLISASTLDQIWSRHITDSAQLLTLLPDNSWTNWLDLGSGAGFPGIVIAIITGKPVTLLESRARRIEYLCRAAEMLDLEKIVDVAGMPLEKLKSKQYAVISARAFAPLPRLLNGAARFSTENTFWLLPKGKNAATELNEAQENWDLMFHVKQSVTDPEAGILAGYLKGPRKH